MAKPNVKAVTKKEVAKKTVAKVTKVEEVKNPSPELKKAVAEAGGVLVVDKTNLDEKDVEVSKKEISKTGGTLVAKKQAAKKAPAKKPVNKKHLKADTGSKVDIGKKLQVGNLLRAAESSTSSTVVSPPWDSAPVAPAPAKVIAPIVPKTPEAVKQFKTTDHKTTGISMADIGLSQQKQTTQTVKPQSGGLSIRDIFGRK